MRHQTGAARMVFFSARFQKGEQREGKRNYQRPGTVGAAGHIKNMSRRLGSDPWALFLYKDEEGYSLCWLEAPI
jgi:hypothetical protein